MTFLSVVVRCKRTGPNEQGRLFITITFSRYKSDLKRVTNGDQAQPRSQGLSSYRPLERFARSRGR